MTSSEFLREVTLDLAALFRRDLRRLSQEVEAFPDDASLWQVVPGVSNSAGNLVLHLEGNLREYFGRRLGGIPYERNRPNEFAEKGLSRPELIVRLESLAVIPEVVQRMTEAQWLDVCVEDSLVGGRSIGQFVLSLYGHFHFHLGQIDYLRRVLTKGNAVAMAQLEA